MNPDQIAQTVETKMRRVVGRKVAPHDVCDVVQDALLSCVRGGHFGEDRDTYPPDGEVMTIARRRAADFHRGRQRRSRQRKVLEATPVRADYLVDFELGERKELTRAALAQLKPENRRIIEEHYFHNRSYREIADRMGVPCGTIRSRAQRAIRLLRPILQSLE